MKKIKEPETTTIYGLTKTGVISNSTGYKFVKFLQKKKWVCNSKPLRLSKEGERLLKEMQTSRINLMNKDLEIFRKQNKRVKKK